MHETSLVRSLLKQVNRLMIQHAATSVDGITVEIGLLSGVEAELVRDAFLQLVPSAGVGLPELQIKQIGLDLCCRDCGLESTIADLTLQCPGCRSAQIRILRGDEFRLIDVSLQIPAARKGVVQ